MIQIIIRKPSAKLLQLVKEAKQLHGFWGSAAGTASLAQVAEKALVEYWEHPENFEHCAACGKKLFISSMHGELNQSGQPIECKSCGEHSYLINQPKIEKI